MTTTRTPAARHAATLWIGDNNTASADCAHCDWEIPSGTNYVTAAIACDDHNALKL